MRKAKNYTIYDVVERKEISIEVGSIVKTCRELNIDSTTLPKLNDKSHIYHRYILPEAKNRVFTLVDIETGIEYDCITNATIFLHFNKDYSDNESKYVYELRKGRQGKASICGKLFYLKGGRESKITSKTKVLPNQIKEKLELLKIKKIIRARLQARISAALSASNVYKNAKTEEFLGCKIDSFREYIESKFTNLMGWHNRDLWHIDHIKPCSSFNLTIPEEQKKCFHYTNLQPIWKTTRVAKEMGEMDYEGNNNKWDIGPEYDYFLLDKLSKNFSDEIPRSEAKELAIKLFSLGLRKVLPEHQ